MALRLAACCRRLLFTLVIFYICLVIFSLFNYCSQCVFTSPETLIGGPGGNDMDSSMCRVEWGELGLTKVDILKMPSFNFTKIENPEVGAGGYWKPKNCLSWQKVAIVIPYRNRLNHLKILLNRLHPMLYKQKIDYRIFIIEQMMTILTGKLMNIGFVEALKYDNYDCFIFHDVDLIPEHDKNLYLCDNHVRQLSSAIDEIRYHIMYYQNVGGVITIKQENFRKTNGFANSNWGWGNEDDDFSNPRDWFTFDTSTRKHRSFQDDPTYERSKGFSRVLDVLLPMTNSGSPDMLAGIPVSLIY